MGDSSDADGQSRGNGNTSNIRQGGTIPSTSKTIETANNVNIDNATFYDMVCTTMKQINAARTREKATTTGKKRANTQRTNAVPSKKSHYCETCTGKFNHAADLKSAKPRRKERKNAKRRDRAMSSSESDSSRSESTR